MLSLNDTPTNDNEAVFLLEINCEGSNLIGNSGFDSDSSTGWTLTGDWAVNSNELQFDFVDDATGTARYTVSQLSAATYVFEYEIMYASGTFALYLEGGGGGSILTNDLTLPQTLGKHSLRFVANTGTLVSIAVTGMDGTDEVDIDDIKLRKLEDVIRLSTRDITLTGNVFDGQVIQYNELTDVDAYIDTEAGGGIGAITGYSFKIARHTANTRTDGFFNEFFPAYNGGQLIAREIKFGVVWDSGTPAYTDVTWLMNGKVIDYSYEPRAINIIVLQSTEIDAREVPYYSIQKDFNNFVSYFENAPEENYGAIIPIVYGDFGTCTRALMDTFTASRYAPGIIVDQGSFESIYCSHKVETASNGQAAGADWDVMKYLPGLDIYGYIVSTGSSGSNTELNCRVVMLQSADVLYAGLWIPLNELSEGSDIDDISNLTDQDESTYVTVEDTGGTDNVLALRIKGSTSTGEVGYVDTINNGSATVYFRASNNDDGANTRAYTIKYRNEGLATPADGTDTSSTVAAAIADATHAFATATDANADSQIPWTIEELQSLDYYFTNDDADAGDDIRVYRAYIYIVTKLTGAVGRYHTIYGWGKNPWKGVRPIGILPITQYEGRAEDPWAPYHFSHATRESKGRADNVFCFMKGREFGRWTDTILAGARSNGYNEGDLIECPPYIIESILRDELFTERDMRMDSSADTTHFVDAEAMTKEDDWYNYSEFINAGTPGARVHVSDYVASTNTFTIDAADANLGATVNYFLTNIQGDNKIDYATFDAIGNTTNGTRKSWKFARSVNTKQPIQSLLNELLFESHCIMFETADETTGKTKIKIKALDKASATEFDTINNPMQAKTAGNIEQLRCSLTPLANVFTSFELFYHYDYGKGDYTKSILVDRNGYSNPSGGTTLTDEHQNLCQFAEDTYRIRNPFTYSSNWIYDDATAEFFLDKKIRWFTEQRLRVTVTEPIGSDGDSGYYIQWEVGDQGVITYTQGMPAEYEWNATTADSHLFMITSKRIVTNPQGSPYIIFELIDMGI